jgi:nucleoside-diphosphate-sugar epimerase
MTNGNDSSPAAGTTVVVTGGSGFLGGHIVRRLLGDGYRVRATVRSPQRAPGVHQILSATGTGPAARLEVTVADLDSDSGWADVMEGTDYVLHVASPFRTVDEAHAYDLIRPARDGALRVLAAARDGGARRVVMTSSFPAVGYSRTSDREFTEEDWTDPADDNTPYIRSKAIAERAAWDFMDFGGDGMELAVINPVGIFGPVLDGHLSASTGLVKAMLDGQMPAAPPMFFGVVDVRDVADLHLRAMTHPRAAGQRFLAASGKSISFLQMAAILSRRLGDAGDRVPAVELTPEQVREAAKTNPALREAANRLGQVPVISSRKAREVLGWAPRDPETTIVDTAVSLL